MYNSEECDCRCDCPPPVTDIESLMTPSELEMWHRVQQMVADGGDVQ